MTALGGFITRINGPGNDRHLLRYTGVPYCVYAMHTVVGRRRARVTSRGRRGVRTADTAVTVFV